MCGGLTANQEAPAAVLSDAASGRQYFLRTAGESDLTITGPGYALLAWLIGRESDGAACPPTLTARCQTSPLYGLTAALSRQPTDERTP